MLTVARENHLVQRHLLSCCPNILGVAVDEDVGLSLLLVLSLIGHGQNS